jgi:hypothetical protein
MPRTMRVRNILILALLFLAPSCHAQVKPVPQTNAIAPAVNPAELEAAVALLCKPADIIRSQNGAASGCKKCPAGTDFYGQNMGEWEMRNSLSGHFTSPADDNLIVGGFNCDSHANNFGGSFIFSLKSGKPRLLKYDNGLVTDSCHKFRYADGREFLVCQGGWTGQGENDSSVFLARFEATGKDNETIVFTTSDSTATCGDDASVQVIGSNVKELKFTNKDSGELTGMTIVATFGKITCGQANVKRAPGTSPPSVKTYELHYNFDGKQFTIAPESRAALRAIPQ